MSPERKQKGNEKKKTVDYVAILDQPTYYATGLLDSDSLEARIPNFEKEVEGAKSDTEKTCLFAREGMVGRMRQQYLQAAYNEKLNLNMELAYQILITGYARASKNFLYLYNAYSYADPERLKALVRSLELYTNAIENGLAAETNGTLTLARVDKIVIE